MKRHPFSASRRKMNPQRRARNQRRRKTMARLLLSELRQQSDMTQRQLAAALGIKQPTLAHIEKQDDIQVSTLRRLVEALGGELDLVVRLPKGEFRIHQFQRRRSA